MIAKSTARAFALAGVLATAATMLALALPAVAGAAAPAFSIESIATPSHLPPENSSGTLDYIVIVKNIGSAPTDGTPITITDSLPAGVSLDEASSLGDLSLAGDGENPQDSVCEAVPPLSCTTPITPIKNGPFTLLSPVLQPGGKLYMLIPIKTEGGAGPIAVNEVTVSGGGAAPVSATESTSVSAEAAPFGFQALGASLTDADGQLATQAGSHPYNLNLRFYINSVTEAGNPPAGSMRDILVTLPRGVVVNPLSTPVRCTEAQLESNDGEFNGCPDASAIGIAHPAAKIGGFPSPAFNTPLYNMVPQPGVPAEFAVDFAAAGIEILVHIQAGINNDGQYELTGITESVSQLANPSGVDIDIWGSPTDPSHDRRRGNCVGAKSAQLELSCPVPASGVPAISMPSACQGPLSTIFSANSWQLPGVFVTESAQSVDSEGNPGGVTGCEALDFEPILKARPTTDVADSPSGLEVDLQVPQTNSHNELATANLKKTVVTLPEGLVVNPSAANGLAGCSPAQIGLTTAVGQTPIGFNNDRPSCPNGSKLGTVEVNTPLLEDPLPGAVYLALPQANPFGSLLALYVVVDDPQTGVVIKLAGRVDADPQTGRLTSSFDENPALPFSNFKLKFFGGPQGSLRTPSTCGAYTTTSELTPYSAPQSGPPAQPSDSWSIAQSPAGACASSPAELPNSPFFEAGTVSPLAATYSPFVVRLQREDGSQNFASLSVTPPPGLVAKLAGVPYCPDAAIAEAQQKTGQAEQAMPSCPAASQVGSVTAGAGAGPAPYYAPGAVYLAGPYKGAPLSFVIVTPAVAGPFDLGTVVVRSALFVDERTARVTVKSDPIPQILQGIPLDVRSIVVRIDRPQFTLNPTNCNPLSALGELSSVLGQTAALFSRFQVGECGKLRFKPQLKLSLKGSTKRSGHPALKAVVTYPKGGGYANIAFAQVGLPRAEFVDQGNLDKVCNQAKLRSATCPATSIYGRAKAWTPLLDKPLEGPVYLGVGYGHELPDVVADLNGQIRVLLNGRVDTTKKGGIRNTFEVVPDAPVEKFVLEMKGGRKYGLIENSENVCRKTQRASARFKAQNGAVLQLSPKIINDCDKGKRRR